MEEHYIALYNSELFNSSLLISEYTYKTTRTSLSYKYIILNLFRLGYYKKVLQIIENENKLLDDYDIRIVFYKSINLTNQDINSRNYVNILSKKYKEIEKNNRNEKNENVCINLKSSEKYWKALTKRDLLRKELFIKSYRLDTRNMENLYFLIKEELVTQKELDILLESSPCKNEYNQILEGTSREFYHPFYIFIKSRKLFLERDTTELFNLSHEAYKVYDTSVYTYLSLGLYFLLTKNYKESKRFLHKIIEIDVSNGQAYLYLGICYSALRECENSLSCFSICNKRMIFTWKSYYYLAKEYQRMTNFEKARFYYKEGIAIDRNVKMQEAYIILLIFCEDYKEALSYLSSILSVKREGNMDNVHLLKCYCYLFLGNINESKKYLEKCTKSYKYFCTAGYIEHLTNNLDCACDLYNKALLLKESTIVENLMNKAFERNKENDVYNTCTEVFEYVFIRDQEIDVI